MRYTVFKERKGHCVFGLYSISYGFHMAKYVFRRTNLLRVVVVLFHENTKELAIIRSSNKTHLYQYWHPKPTSVKPENVKKGVLQFN